MSYWPSSALWTLLNDPLTHFFKFVYRRLSSMFEGMSKKMFAKYDNDFVAVVAEPAAGIDAIPPLPLETRTGRHPRGGVNGGHIG
jgi:hypothetical protein